MAYSSLLVKRITSDLFRKVVFLHYYVVVVVFFVENYATCTFIFVVDSLYSIVIPHGAFIGKTLQNLAVF